MTLHFAEKTSNLERSANPIIPREREREILTFHLTHLHNVTILHRLPSDKLLIWFLTAFEVLPTIKATKLFLPKIWVNADYISMLYMALWEDTKTIKHMKVSTWGPSINLAWFWSQTKFSLEKRYELDLPSALFYICIFYIHCFWEMSLQTLW